MQVDGRVDLRAPVMETFVAWLTPCEHWKTMLSTREGNCPRCASQVVATELQATSKGSVSLRAESLSSDRYRERCSKR